MSQSLGLLEVKGLLGAVTAADTMAKAANVTLVGIERAKGFAWFTVKVTGQVGAVQSAIEAGKTEMESLGLFITAKVIPRAANVLFDVFNDDESDDSNQPVVEESSETTTEIEAITEVEAAEILQDDTSSSDEIIKKEANELAHRPEGTVTVLVEDVVKEEAVEKEPIEVVEEPTEVIEASVEITEEPLPKKDESSQEKEESVESSKKQKRSRKGSKK